MSTSEMVREFHEAFGLPVRYEPVDVSRSEKWLRIDLLEEEYNEYISAALAPNLVEVADALADMVYVIHGTALAYGINLDVVLAEVHRSNMTKLGEDGKPIYREDGKVVKGPKYEAPRIAEVLGL